MGANVYLKAIGSLGYKTATAATAILQYIQPRSGERVAIRAFGMTCGGTKHVVYFMVPLAAAGTTITTAVASGATTGFIGTAEPQTAANAMASGDYIAIELDNGTYQFTTVATGLYTGFSIAAALTDTVAAGNSLFAFGIQTDTGHIQFNIAASTQTTKEIDGGVIYGVSKGSPMIVYHPNNSAAAGSQDYVAIDYLNK